MRETMSYTPITDPRHETKARASLSALQEALALIEGRNTDPALHALIKESLSHCASLEQYLGRLVGAASDSEATVDLQVFERLMVLAGPTTMLELLDQLLIDLHAAQKAIAQAGPQLDWQILRNQCHVLIAVAGSIGALPVLQNSEKLQSTAHAENAADAALQIKSLLRRLQVLIAFVQNERQQRAAA
jgi:two-component system, OmpR family, aerobic respiration control sensor histidine kinase ArcB